MLITNLIFTALLNNAALIYHDVYFTKLGVNQYHLIEQNPIAKLFVLNNMYNELYFSAVLANLAISLIPCERYGFLNLFILDLISLAEIYVIAKSLILIPDLNPFQVKAILFNIRF